jgi:L-asparaginase
MNLKKTNIYIIYTGGTIGMKPTSHGYSPEPGFLGEYIQNLPEFFHHSMPNFTLYEHSPLIDSSNMSPQHWQDIANIIQKEYENYDGFVVLHGTDTMAYTASALSFMFENLSKPVIVTGSQIPLSQLRSDGQHNLLNAMYLAAHFPIHEVTLFFNNQLFRGNRTTKVCADSFNAFDAPNHHVLIESGIKIKVNQAQIESPIQRRLRVQQIKPQAISILSLYPGIDFDWIAQVLDQPIKALILMTFGAGNAPQDPKLLKLLKKADSQQKITINLSQCMQGSVNMQSYAAGQALQNVGMISGLDMTKEASLAKIHYLLSGNHSYHEIKAKFGTSLRGELTEK